MPSSLSVGLYLPQNVPPERLFAWARVAEDAGLSALWLPDHLHQFPDRREGRLEAWTLLSALAVETSTIRLGLGVCNVQLRNPALLAKMAFTVDRLSGGRFDLALGTGGNAGEMRAYGIEPAAGLAARRRLRDTVLILRALEWGGPADTPQGSDATLRAAFCRPGATQRPFPLAVAADHPDTMRIAAQHADCWFANLASPVVFAERNMRMTSIARAVQREPRTLARSAHVLAIVGRTELEAQDAAARYRTTRRARLFQEPHIVGNAAQVGAALAAYRTAGATRAAVYLLNLPWCGETEGDAIIRVLAKSAVTAQRGVMPTSPDPSRNAPA